MSESIDKNINNSIADKKNFISVVQVISMLLIVLSHSIPEKILVPEWILLLTPYLQKTGLAIFVATSGYLAIYTNQLNKYGYIKYLSKRAVRLLVPYIVLNIVLYVPKVILIGGVSAIRDFNLVSFLIQLITPREGVLPHLWFLPTLFLLCASLPIFVRLNRKTIFVVVTLGMCVLALFIPSLTKLLSIDDYIDYLVWFDLGVVFANNERWIQKEFRLIIVGVCALFVSLLFRLLSITVLFWFFYTLSTLLIMIGLGLIFEKKEISLTFLKKYSFCIYLLSLPIQNVINLLLIKITQNPYIIYCSLFVVGVLIPLFVAKIVEVLERKSSCKILSKIIGI